MIERRVLAAIGALCLGGCGGGTPSPDGGAPPDMVSLPDLAAPADLAMGWSPSHPALCGTPEYGWLPAAQVGAVLEQNQVQDLTVQQLQGLVTQIATLVVVHHPVTYPVRLHVVRYQTQDRGKLVDATMMLAYPNVTAPQKFPLLLYLHGTTGFDDPCAPSRSAADLTKANTVLAVVAASNGYVAVLPDYLGMKSLGAPSTQPTPYDLLEPTAIAALDAARAATPFLAAQAPMVATGHLYVAGHSQGGLGSAQTVRLQPYYAPELPIAGAAFVAPSTDLAGQIKTALDAKAPPSLFGFGLLVGGDDWYQGPALSGALVSPWDTMAPSIIADACAPNRPDPFAGITDGTTLLQPALVAALEQPAAGADDPWSCWVREAGVLTSSVPIGDQTPALFVLGEKDQQVVDSVERASFTALCGRGQKLQYLECAAADHNGALADSYDDLLDFFDARERGDPLPATVCQVAAPVTCSSTP